MLGQKILTASKDYVELDQYFTENQIKKILLVCDSSIDFLQIKNYFEKINVRKEPEIIRFSNFQSNPLYESVVEGVKVFNDNRCQAIVAVGGGSAMDVAKCIKLYSNMDHEKNYLEQEIIPNDIKLLAVPTTAGTGSEATRYAVIYYNGEKQSITHESCIPETVLMDPSVLKTLPLYQKKSTMLDAFCHCIESYWSINSTEESKEFSRKGIQMILANKGSYLANEESGNANMMQAAYLGGKAINITQTTAGHAMCYKLTSLYGIAHGHAAALCVRKIWPYMIQHVEDCVDPRGEKFLRSVFEDLALDMGCQTPEKAAEKFQKIFDDLGMEIPKANPEDYQEICSSVNPVRLRNNPVKLDNDAIYTLYHQILCSGD